MKLWSQILELSENLNCGAQLYDLSDEMLPGPMERLLAYPLGRLNKWKTKPQQLYVLVHANNKATVYSRENIGSAFLCLQEVALVDNQIDVFKSKRYHIPRVPHPAVTNRVQHKFSNQENTEARIRRCVHLFESYRLTPQLHQLVGSATREVKEKLKTSH